MVSTSGIPPNGVKASEYANAKSASMIAYIGVKESRLKDIATRVIHVDVHNHGIVEDIQMSLIHVLTRYMTARAPS